MRFVSWFCDVVFLLRFLRSDYGILFLPSLLKMLVTSRVVTRSPGFDVCSFPRSRVGASASPGFFRRSPVVLWNLFAVSAYIACDVILRQP